MLKQTKICLLISILILSSFQTTFLVSEAVGNDLLSPLSLSIKPVNDREYYPAVMQMINNSQDRIHILEYLLEYSGPVADILDNVVSAHERGVEVMIMVDEIGHATLGAVNHLKSNNITVKFDSPNKKTHNKMIIVDDLVLLGSTNFSPTSINFAHEANLLVEDPEITSYYEEYFQGLWADPLSDPSPEKTGHSNPLPCVNREVFPNLLDLINSATQRIRVVLYSMVYREEYPGSEYNQLLEALISAKKNGVDVKVILDNGSFNADNGINFDAATILEENGIAVGFTPRYQVTHSKVVLADDTVIIGDSNWGYGALNHYNGVSMRVRDESIAGVYSDYFEMIWLETDGALPDEGENIDEKDPEDEKEEGPSTKTQWAAGIFIMVVFAALIIIWNIIQRRQNNV